MFDTKAGAWLYKLFNGGDQILQDQSSQQYFVSRQIPDDNADDVATVTVRREFGWSDSQNWQYNTPLWGSAMRAQDALNDGNYFDYVGHMGMGVAEGLTFGTLTLEGIAVRGVQAGAGSVVGETITKGGYTRSSLKLGREMHKAYRAENVVEGISMKEFRGIPGIRPDFVDFSTKTIYELKPFNPRAVQQGWNQLNKYQNLFQQKYGGTWKTVLETY